MNISELCALGTHPLIHAKASFEATANHFRLSAREELTSHVMTRELFAKWNEIAFNVVLELKTVKECVDVLPLIPQVADVEESYLIKWLSITQTINEAESVWYFFTVSNNPAPPQTVKRNCMRIARRLTELAKTSKDAHDIHSTLYRTYESRGSSLWDCIEFWDAHWAKVCSEELDQSPSYAELRRIAVLHSPAPKSRVNCSDDTEYNNQPQHRALAMWRASWLIEASKLQSARWSEELVQTARNLLENEPAGVERKVIEKLHSLARPKS